MKKLIPILAVASVLSAFVIRHTNADDVISQLNRYLSTYPQEKAYLHLDKPYYTAGETIWLKAYLVEANSNMPDTVSVPLYLELIDNQLGAVIERKTLKMDGGFSIGNFELADSLHAGYYSLRAYTSWMLNFDESLLFRKDFKIHRVEEAEEIAQFNPQDVDFRFFPEGGQIVEGMDNKVAFKATDSFGNGVDVSGIIRSGKGDTVMQFQSEHRGMGVFNFRAEPQEQYVAKIMYRNIHEKEVQLPIIEKQGFIMGIEAVVDKNQMRLYVGHNYNKPKASGDMVLIGQAQGTICYMARTPVSGKSMSLKIPKDKFPEGVVQFTVFDETGKPRCERLVYVHHEDRLNVQIKPDKSIYQPREAVRVEIEAKNEKGEPIAGNFSVVVSDSKQVQAGANGENILNYLRLSSDVRGKVEQPDYYFSQNKPGVRRHLDILLMTQGWRRFRWDDVLKPVLPEPKFMAERGLTFSGEVTRQNGKLFEKPLNLTYMLWLEDDQRMIGTGQAATDGTFAINELDFTGTGKMLVQAVAGKMNRNTRIFINKPPSPKLQLVSIPYNPVDLDEKELADYLKRTKEAIEFEKILKARKERLLQEVTVRAKRTAERDNRVIYGRASNTLRITPDMNVTGNVLDLLRGRVPGVQVSGNQMDPTVLIRGVSSITGSSEPTFLLDGMIVDKQMILTIPIFDVDKIDVLKGADAAIYGSRGGNGVISVLTKRGSDAQYSGGPPQGIEVTNVNGYAVAKEFYSPNYLRPSADDVQMNARPDFRSTIYWAPIVKTNEKGKATISFFNSDAPTNVDIRVEGISYEGIPASAVNSYLVKK